MNFTDEHKCCKCSGSLVDCYCVNRECVLCEEHPTNKPSPVGVIDCPPDGIQRDFLDHLALSEEYARGEEKIKFLCDQVREVRTAQELLLKRLRESHSQFHSEYVGTEVYVVNGEVYSFRPGSVLVTRLSSTTVNRYLKGNFLDALKAATAGQMFITKDR